MYLFSRDSYKTGRMRTRGDGGGFLLLPHYIGGYKAVFTESHIRNGFHRSALHNVPLDG